MLTNGFVGRASAHGDAGAGSVGMLAMRSDYAIPTIVAGAGAVVATALAAVLVALQAATGGQSAHLTGRVQIGADSCQSFVIDHKTDFISHDQRAACTEAAKNPNARSRKSQSSFLSPAAGSMPFATLSTSVEEMKNDRPP